MTDLNKTVEFERTYDAPLDKVWQAWTNPDELKQWWGPDNVIIQDCEIDLQVGGRFYLVMEADEGMGPYKGTRWPIEAKFTLIEPKTKFAYDAKAWTEGDEEATMITQTQEVTFSEQDGKTKMNLKVLVKTIGPKAGAAIEGMNYGFNQQFEKLNKFLQAKG